MLILFRPSFKVVKEGRISCMEHRAQCMGQGTEFSDNEYFLHLAKVWHKFDNDINRPQMSSIIEGYNYDIFISYRQKDNKGDRWVSEFVEFLL
jgi:hypothetical protein